MSVFTPHLISEQERKALTVSPDYVKFLGGYFKYKCAESVLIQYIYYGLKLDVILNKISKSWNLSADENIKKYLSESEQKNEQLVSEIKKHMFKCYRLAKLKPVDYFLFNLRNKTDEEIKNYLSDAGMMELLSKTGARQLHNIELNEKCNFYKIASHWFFRDVAIIESTNDFDEFLAITTKHKRVIIKPASVGCGQGIFIYDSSCGKSPKAMFDEIMIKGNSYIIEELISQGKEMSSWNESSVNTLRINTYKNKKGVFNHVCFIRTGRAGSFVDNGGQGGIFACIDSNTGKIMTDGYDEHGRSYETHPDSGIEYKGWQIPNWNEVLELAKYIHKTAFPKHPYIAWDFAQSKNGWVLIEGNWGQFVAQQICLGHGVKNEIIALLKGTN